MKDFGGGLFPFALSSERRRCHFTLARMHACTRTHARLHSRTNALAHTRTLTVIAVRRGCHSCFDLSDDGSFAMVIIISSSVCLDTPLDFRVSQKIGQLPLPNNETSLANAVAIDGDIVYLMGSFGSTGKAFITRISTQDFELGAWSSLELWANCSSWISYSDFDVSKVAILFDFMASETTLQYHNTLKAWFVVIVNSFIYGPTIMLRVAASPYGTWSQPIAVFEIPPQFLQHSDFCYAGKAHPGKFISLLFCC